MNLADCLAKLPGERLLRLCSRYEIDAQDMAPGACVIARCILEEQVLSQQLHELNQEEMAALKIIAFASGGKGVIVEQCHQKLNRMTRKWRRNGALVIDALVQRGFVYRERSHYRQVYFIPCDLRQRICTLVGSDMVEHVIIDSVDTVDAGQDPNLALRTLHFLLSYVRKSGVRLTQTGEIFRRAQRGLAETLGLAEDTDLHTDPAANLRFMLDFLRSYGLLRHLDTHLEIVPEKVEEWAARDPWEKRIELFRFWESNLMDQDPDFATILGFLRFVPEDKWVVVDRLMSALEPVGMSHSWQALPQRLDKFFFSYLSQNGIVMLGHAGNRLACRLTHLGRILLEGKRRYSERWEYSFFVQPNFEILVPRDIDLKVLWEIEQVADLVKHDQMMVYLLSRSSIYRALKEGMSDKRVSEFLAQHSKNPVPQNVSFSIANWCSRFGRMHFIDALLLHCETPELAAEIQSSLPLREFILGSYTPQHLVVSKKHYDAFLVALEEQGFMPLPGIAEPGERETDTLTSRERQ